MTGGPIAEFDIRLTEADLQALRDGKVIVAGVSGMEYTLNIRYGEGGGE